MPTETSASKLTHTQLKRVLPPGKMVGKEYETQCPLCSHFHLRLFGADGIKCMNGCDTGEIVAILRGKLAHVEKPKEPKPSERPDWSGFTLEDYCRMKRLSQLALNVFFGTYPSGEATTLEAKHRGKPVVAFPYMDSEGRVLATKIRLSHNSHDTYFRPKDPHIPYGLWLCTNRPDAEGKGPQDIVICEGESDTQTLFAHNIPALGISGSKGWRPEFAQLPPIRDAERIFIVEEPDADGQQFVRRVSNDLPPEKVFALKLSEKDPSALHIGLLIRKEFQEPDLPTFIEELNDSIAKAQPAARPFGTASAIEEDKLPPFPEITGTIRELAEALCPSLPYEYKVGSAMTILGTAVSGRVSLRGSPHIQPRLYSCLVGVAGSGKSGAVAETKKALSGTAAGVKFQLSADSGPGLVQCLRRNPRMLLTPDEIVDIFDKGKQSKDSRNSLLTEILRLYDGNETENAAKGNLKEFGEQEQTVKDAHFAVLGGATTAVFQQMWMGTRGAAGGLQDRFTLFTSDRDSIPEPQEPSSGLLPGILDRLAGQVADADGEVVEPPEMARRRQEWWAARKKEVGAGQRIPAMVSRLLILLAVTNGKRTVDSELLEQALKFGEYQIRLRKRLMPADAYGWVQAFEQLIIKMFMKHGANGLTRNNLRRYVNPEQHPGGYGPFLQAWANLVTAERLRVVDKSQRSPIYVLETG